MHTFRKWRKPLASVMIVAMTVLSAPILPASAAIVGTDTVLEQTQSAERARVLDFMSRADVAAELQKLGVSPDEARDRVAALSDDEINRIAGKLDTLPAGEGAIGAILGAAVLIFIVLLITDLVGLTNVFGFTNKGALNPN